MVNRNNSIGAGPQRIIICSVLFVYLRSEVKYILDPLDSCTASHYDLLYMDLIVSRRMRLCRCRSVGAFLIQY